MKITKRLGIWMDHSTAHIMVFSSDIINTDSVITKEIYTETDSRLRESESQEHNRNQKVQSEFYKKLADTIKKYEEVILFGPTNARIELLNILNADQQFDSIKIDAIQMDKMTENQQHTFVRDYFSEK